jgi:hypothetical protein
MARIKREVPRTELTRLGVVFFGKQLRQSSFSASLLYTRRDRSVPALVHFEK